MLALKGHLETFSLLEIGSKTKGVSFVQTDSDVEGFS